MQTTQAIRISSPVASFWSDCELSQLGAFAATQGLDLVTHPSDGGEVVSLLDREGLAEVGLVKDEAGRYAVSNREGILVGRATSLDDALGMVY